MKPRHPRLLARLLLLGGALGAAGGPASSETILAFASKDNTLYEDPFGELSNGAGQHFFVGQSAMDRTRRGLIEFDLGAIPPGSTITSVSLRLYMSRANQAGAEPASLHRALTEWGEAGSVAGGEEGAGEYPMMGDATWLHTFFNTQFWTAPGGDLAPTSSATTIVGSNGFYTWSTAAMAADVQAWVNDPAANHGWVVVGNETTFPTALRFDSRQVQNSNRRPVLTIEFTSPLPTGACCLDGGVCVETDASTCAGLGGVYQGDGTDCDPNPCPQPTGACCLGDGTCIIATHDDCNTMGGMFIGPGTDCDPDPCQLVLTPYLDPLPLPTPAQPVSGKIGGAAHYEIAMVETFQQLHSELPPTRVWGYAGSYPGPTIEARRGEPVTVTWINDLRDDKGNLRTTHVLPIDECLHGPDMTGQLPMTVVHLHGGHVGPESDGHPDLAFPPGMQSPLYTYPNNQPAATIWYHDHGLGITRLNVYMGLAGFYLIRDDAEDGLDLPRGEFEVPLAIQDRSFHADGSFAYPHAWQEHFFGDFILVNGKVWPYLEVKPGKYRFRMLNGSNSRFYTLSLSNGRGFVQIGSDGGLLPAPVKRPLITFGPGERVDVIVDFEGLAPGTEALLTNSAPSPFPGTPGEGVVQDVMKFIVVAGAAHTGALPAELVEVPAIPESEAEMERDFLLRRTMVMPANSGGHGGHPGDCEGMVWTINDLLWDDITEFPRLGGVEIWSFVNASGITHPMHMHLVQFQALDRQTFNLVGGEPVPTGPRIPLPPEDRGWKDTILVPPNEIVRVIARFEGFTGLFPYHCHILEHEDHEMMRQFEVVCVAPNIEEEPEAQDFVVGAQATFSVGATLGPLTYQWRRDGQPISDGPGGASPGGGTVSGAQGPALAISGVAGSDAGVYDCVVTNLCESSPSQPAPLIVRCIGDADGDGTITFVDLNALLGQYQAQVAPFSGADFSGDGVINFQDLNLLLGVYNLPCGPF